MGGAKKWNPLDLADRVHGGLPESCKPRRSSRSVIVNYCATGKGNMFFVQYDDGRIAGLFEDEYGDCNKIGHCKQGKPAHLACKQYSNGRNRRNGIAYWTDYENHDIHQAEIFIDGEETVWHCEGKAMKHS